MSVLLDKDIFSSASEQSCVHVQIKRGEVFISETDTEVIPKLCNYVYKSTQEKLSFNEVPPHHPITAFDCRAHYRSLVC